MAKSSLEINLESCFLVNKKLDNVKCVLSHKLAKLETRLYDKITEFSSTHQNLKSYD